MPLNLFLMMIIRLVDILGKLYIILASIMNVIGLIILGQLQAAKMTRE